MRLAFDGPQQRSWTETTPVRKPKNCAGPRHPRNNLTRAPGAAGQVIEWCVNVLSAAGRKSRRSLNPLPGGSIAAHRDNDRGSNLPGNVASDAICARSTEARLRYPDDLRRGQIPKQRYGPLRCGWRSSRPRWPLLICSVCGSWRLPLDCEFVLALDKMEPSDEAPRGIRALCGGRGATAVRWLRLLPGNPGISRARPRPQAF